MPSNTEYAELIERLNATKHIVVDFDMIEAKATTEERLVNPDGPEAATALERLSSDREMLREECRRLKAELREQVPYSSEEIEVFQTAMDRGLWSMDDTLTGTRDEKIERARSRINTALGDKE